MAKAEWWGGVVAPHPCPLMVATWEKLEAEVEGGEEEGTLLSEGGGGGSRGCMGLLFPGRHQGKVGVALDARGRPVGTGRCMRVVVDKGCYRTLLGVALVV